MVARSLAKISPRMSNARARSLATRTTLRSTRSARTPASGLAMVGSRRATSAPPTAEALPVIWTTSTTSATIETASPTNEVPWPIQRRKKRAFLRRESLVESIPYPRQRESSPAPVERSPCSGSHHLAYPMVLLRVSRAVCGRHQRFPQTGPQATGFRLQDFAGDGYPAGDIRLPLPSSGLYSDADAMGE